MTSLGYCILQRVIAKLHFFFWLLFRFFFLTLVFCAAQLRTTKVGHIPCTDEGPCVKPKCTASAVGTGRRGGVTGGWPQCGCLDTQLLVEPTKGVADDVKLVPKLLHHAVDAGRVFQDVHALGVRVVPYREGTLDGLGKLPVDCSHGTLWNAFTSLASLSFIWKIKRSPTHLILTLASSKLSDTK